MIAIAAALPSSAQAATINSTESIDEGQYLYYELSNPGVTGAWDIDVSWTSSLPADTFVLSHGDFSRYEGGLTFHPEVQQSGTSGVVHFEVAANRSADEPFYLVFDHTTDGPTDPPSAPGDQATAVTAAGTTTRAGATAAAGLSGVFAALSVVVLIGIVVIVAVVIFALRKRARSGMVGAVAGIPVAQLPGTQGVAGGTVATAQTVEPSGAGYPAPTVLGTEAAQVVCTSCGAGLAAFSTHCANCGLPL